VVTIFGKTGCCMSRKSPRDADENLAMIADTSGFSRIMGSRHLRRRTRFDGYKDNPDYAIATLQAAEHAGADLIVLCDTNGGSLPSEISRITRTRARSSRRESASHAQRHRPGCGKRHRRRRSRGNPVQGTINGYGERTGNCN